MKLKRLLQQLGKIKADLLGTNMWSGPGSLRAEATQGEIRDASFEFPGSDDAILLIHGLTGAPAEMRLVGRLLNREGYSVYGMQIAGHCGTEEDLLLTSWQDWYASVEQAYERIAAKHDRIYAAGLSIGSLLALELASRKEVAAVATYSVTFWYDGWATPRLRWLLPLILLTPFGEKYRFVETYPYGVKDEAIRKVVASQLMSGDSTLAGTVGMAGASLREVRRVSAHVRKRLSQIRTPVLALHAKEDDIASLRNLHFLQANIGGPFESVILDDSYHVITIDRQRKLVAEKTASFFRSLRCKETQPCCS